MDELDSKIIQLMMRNARMPVRRASSAAIPCACTTPARITESRR